MNQHHRNSTVGVILAGGRGSRMGGHTELQPKCLAVLAERTLLQWQLAALAHAGIGPITVVGGYRSEMLKGDFELRTNARWAETNMVRTLLEVDDVLRRHPAVVSYSDIVFHPDHAKRLAEADGLSVTYDTEWLALWAQRADDPLADAETFREVDGKVVEIGGRPSSVEEVQGQYMGLLRVDPDVWVRVREYLGVMRDTELDRLDMTSLLGGLIKQGVELGAVPVKGAWCEVDTSEDLALYHRAIAAVDEPWHHDWRWEQKG
jgi:choline kinase